tara:strand:- start:1528 stop:1968 length:441 start_codon:yes stop_codon:yes gene_type:complete
MSKSIARELEKRHEAIMKYTGGDMISFVLTCTELQKEMVAEIERLNEALLRNKQRLKDDRLMARRMKQSKDNEAYRLKGELTQYKSLVHATDNRGMEEIEEIVRVGMLIQDMDSEELREYLRSEETSRFLMSLTSLQVKYLRSEEE